MYCVQVGPEWPTTYWYKEVDGVTKDENGQPVLGVAKYPTLARPFSCDPTRFDFPSAVSVSIKPRVAASPSSTAHTNNPSTPQQQLSWNLTLVSRPNPTNPNIPPVSFGLTLPNNLAPPSLDFDLPSSHSAALMADLAARRSAYPRSAGTVDVIFVAEKGESAEVINWFHASLWEAGWRGRVVIFSADPARPALVSVHDHFRHRGADIQVIKFVDPHGYGLVYARFFNYKRHMDKSWHVYRRVILSDYDVVWQRNPSDEQYLPLGDSRAGSGDGDAVALFAEWGNFTLGECEHHERWIKCGERSGVWDEGTFDDMAPFARICAGVVVVSL
ncbi:hypothetical protein HDU93_002484 [Gonapodya sp. JEL0774]|nr:hypothetical protein HDU93_002484 [Gonapodya sp. JEL0774]